MTFLYIYLGGVMISHFALTVWYVEGTDLTGWDALTAAKLNPWWVVALWPLYVVAVIGKGITRAIARRKVKE